MCRTIFGFPCLAIVILIATNDCRAYVNVYGSPGYTPGVGGYQVNVGFVDFINHPLDVNDTGTAVGSADRYDSSGSSPDRRAVLWNSTTSTELGHLGTAGGLAFTIARAINSAGVAVGGGTVGFGSDRAIRWSGPGTSATQLPTPAGYTGARLQDINASGTSIGMAILGGSTDAARWNSAGTPTILPRPAGFFAAEAYAINDAGTAIGRAFTNDDRAVRWDSAGNLTVLGHLGLSSSGTTTVFPTALNSAGTTIGYAFKHDASGEYQGTLPVRWDAGSTVATELDTFGVGPSGFMFGEPHAISDNGTIVGSAPKYPAFPTDVFGTVAVRWDATGTAITKLGHLGTALNGSTYSTAYDINAAGLIVGTAGAFDNAGNPAGLRAVYWNSTDTAIDLNTLIDPASGWQLTHAYAISDTNWIVGDGYYDPDGPGGQDSYGRHFLLQLPSVPEPATIVLFVVGLASVGFSVRRPHRGRSFRITALAFVLLALSHATVGTAAVKNWTDGSGSWNVGANWSGGTVPGGGDTVNIVTAAAMTAP